MFECFGVEAVTFVDAVGDVAGDGGFGEVEGVIEDGGCGDAVDVVVAVDDDGLVVVDGLADALCGLICAGEQGGVVKVFERWREEVGGGFRGADISFEEKVGDEGMLVDLLCEIIRGDLGGLVGNARCPS